MKRSKQVANATSSDTVVCELCDKKFKARGIKQHQSKCLNKKRRQLASVFDGLDSNSFESVLGFLGNQSVVKLQSITGIEYPGSNVLVSSICCPCENDKLAVANGLCVDCNRAKDAGFQETIKATEAKKLYGVEDIDGVPHETISERSREYRRFKYEDMQRYVEMMFGSKMAWLEMLAVKKNRSRKLMVAKKRKKDEYNALLATFPNEFAEIIRSKCYSRKSAVELQESVERYYAMVAALNAHGLTLQDDPRCSLFIAYGTSQPELLVNSIIQKREFAAFVETLPRAFVDYIRKKEIKDHQSESLAKEQNERYDTLVAALAARTLELQSNSSHCKWFVMRGIGQIDKIVDMMEEIKFLDRHTSYLSDCRAESALGGGRIFCDDNGLSDDEREYPTPGGKIRKRLKTSIRDRFLHDNPRGLILPRKWERMRSIGS